MPCNDSAEVLVGQRWHARFLLAMVLTIATAGLVYELGLAAVASFVLGDSVRQFSLVIGAYLSALGLGAYSSRFVERNLAATFINVELSAALLGGLSAPALLVAFSLGATFQLLLLAVVIAVGTLVGIELPLLMRILERRLPFKDLVSRTLAYDYAGALVGSVGFSLYLVPQLGLVRTSILCGLVNAVVALAASWLLVDRTTERPSLAASRFAAAAVVLLLALGLCFAPSWVTNCESRVFGRIEHAEDTPYQRILLTTRDNSLELYLNGHLQFSSRDECRYHEALVHPALAAIPDTRRVLVAGGGDGLAVREILKWPNIEQVVLVDLDPAVTTLARHLPRLVQLNEGSLNDPRVVVANRDAFQWVDESHGSFDAIIVDFPDPTTYGVGKLFSTAFYLRLRRSLRPHGVVVVQATSPLLSANSFFSIERTLQASGFLTQPLRVFVPSFGDWGFVLASRVALPPSPRIPAGIELRCLDPNGLTALREMPDDSQPNRTAVNRLGSQELVQIYLDETERLN